MKKIILTQDEFVVLAHIIKIDKLILYAGTGLQGKELAKKLEDKKLEVRNSLLQKGFILLNDNQMTNDKVIFSRGIFIFKDKNNYELSNDVKMIKNIANVVEYEIDVLENRNEYNVCVNKLIISSEGYMSIKFNEEAKTFYLEIADKNEKLEFFSEQLQIPTSYTLSQQESYAISLNSDHLEMLINAYTEKDEEGYRKLAQQLAWGINTSRDFLNSTWENENSTNYVVINPKNRNVILNIRIYSKEAKYYLIKAQNSQKAVEVAKQDLNGIIEFFLPQNM